MGKLFSALARTGFRRGRQGSRAWLAVGATTWLLQRAARAVRRTEEPLERFRLAPGETVEITSVSPPTRRERKAARRSA